MKHAKPAKIIKGKSFTLVEIYIYGTIDALLIDKYTTE